MNFDCWFVYHKHSLVTFTSLFDPGELCVFFHYFLLHKSRFMEEKDWTLKTIFPNIFWCQDVHIMYPKNARKLENYHIVWLMNIFRFKISAVCASIFLSLSLVSTVWWEYFLARESVQLKLWVILYQFTLLSLKCVLFSEWTLPKSSLWVWEGGNRHMSMKVDSKAFLHKNSPKRTSCLT